MPDTVIISAMGVLTAMIAVLTPIFKLNSSIVKLNITLDHMLENDRVRDKRITQHGKEIEAIIERQRENEKELSNHDILIQELRSDVDRLKD